ncbi:MAG: hypothetical protein ACREBG_19705 [Pyrinomonadaceae bacterium]
MADQSAVGTQTEECVPVPTLEAFFRGQRDINGRLCDVDWRLLNAISELRNALQNSSLDVDLAAVDRAMAVAQSCSDAVAGVDPPGCRKAT